MRSATSLPDEKAFDLYRDGRCTTRHRLHTAVISELLPETPKRSSARPLISSGGFVKFRPLSSEIWPGSATAPIGRTSSCGRKKS